MSGSTWQKFSLKRRLADAWHAFRFGHTRRDDWRVRERVWTIGWTIRPELKSRSQVSLSARPRDPFDTSCDCFGHPLNSLATELGYFEAWYRTQKRLRISAGSIVPDTFGEYLSKDATVVSIALEQFPDELARDVLKHVLFQAGKGELLVDVQGHTGVSSVDPRQDDASTGRVGQ